MNVQENEKVFFNTLIEKMKSNDTIQTQEKLKKSLLKWININAMRFNNVGIFEKLYPEYTNLLK